jgi:hemolysin D
MIAALRRNWDIARTAWEQDREQASVRNHYDEKAFLPAALEVMETPPNPLGRALLMLLCAMVVVALLWSIIGRLDVVVVSPGKTLPREGLQIVSWSGSGAGVEGATGVVRALHVADGDRVEKGQLLLELDPTISGADTAQARRGFLAAETDQARSRALLSYLATGHAEIVLPPNLSPEDARTQRQLIQSSIDEYEAKAGDLRATRAERVADLATAETERLKLQETLVLLDKELAMRTDLAAHGYQSKVLVYQLQQLRIERARNIELQVTAAAKARAAIAGIDSQLRQLRQELTKGSLSDLGKAVDDASIRDEEITKAKRRDALLRIRAPVAGTVEQLQVHTIGGVVQAAQPLLTIVPQNSHVVVESQVLNRDIGFVHVGQRTAVKIDAFPFTEYGVLDGTVVSIGKDAIAGAGADAKPAAGAVPAQSLVYVVRIALDRPAIMVGDCDRARTPSAACKAVPLTPGLSLQAEIKTGQRRIIQYLLSPLMKAGAEAGRER